MFLPGAMEMVRMGVMEMIIIGLICAVPVIAAIVVLVVVLVVRRGKTPPTGASLSPCPDCGHAVSLAATECPNCGCHLPAQPDE